LSDAELVAILLGSGKPGLSVLDLAQRVIAECGGLDGIAARDTVALSRISGIGPAAASRLAVVGELARRTARAPASQRLKTSADIATVLGPHLDGLTTERLVVAVLTRSLKLIDVVTLADGVTHAVGVPTADILRAVLVRGGAAFALAHNHPGGSMEPSAADRHATITVRDAAEACGLRFIDHLVIVGDRWQSSNE
jgi:DNA repair protein RadC